jgi:hypothetical protein
VPSSGIVNSMIRITGIGDRDRPEWLIRISGMRSYDHARYICYGNGSMSSAVRTALAQR